MCGRFSGEIDGSFWVTLKHWLGTRRAHQNRTCPTWNLISKEIWLEPFTLFLEKQDDVLKILNTTGCVSACKCLSWMNWQIVSVFHHKPVDHGVEVRWTSLRISMQPPTERKKWVKISFENSWDNRHWNIPHALVRWLDPTIALFKHY